MRIQTSSTILIGCLVSLLAFAGCGDDANGTDTSIELEDQNFQGQVAGEDWEFVSGDADPSGDEFNIDLYTGTDEPCPRTSLDDDIDDRVVRVNGVPSEEGEYPAGGMNEDVSVNFIHEDDEGVPQNLLAGQGGTAVVNEVREDEIDVSLAAKHDDDNFGSGNFTATRCENID